MSYYHIKNIKFDKENNNISADLADSCYTPLEYYHIDKLFDDETFEEKFANFIYNVVSGNFHPSTSNRYSKIMMNKILHNYYDDAKDIGILKTYHKYKDVIKGILTHDVSKCIELPSERELHPEEYYILTPIEIDGKYKDNGKFYKNQKGELYCLTGKELMYCNSSDDDYGYPLSYVSNKDNFTKYNDFLNKNCEGKDFELC